MVYNNITAPCLLKRNERYYLSGDEKEMLGKQSFPRYGDNCNTY